MNKRTGVLTALLRLDGAQFNKSLKSTRARIVAFAGFVKRVLAPLAALAAGVGSVRAVGQTLNMVDAQAKLARSLNTSVESMQVLRRAGELAGVGQAQLAQGSKDLFRRLSQGAAGTGAAAKALDRLQLSASDLLALPLDQRIAKINGALADFVPEAERAAVAGALFGEEGSIAMTRLDPATLAQAAAEVEKFGRTISDVEAGKIEQANDAMSRLGLVMRGLGTDLTIAIAPALDRAATALANLAPTWRAIMQGVQDAFVVVRSFVSFLYSSAGDASGALTSAVASYFGFVRNAYAALGQFLSGARAIIDQTGSFAGVWDRLKAIAVEVAQRVGDVFRAAGLSVKASFQQMAGSAQLSLGKVVASAFDWAARMADVAIGANNAMIAAFKALPSAVGSLMFQAANAAIQGVEGLVNGVVSRLNKFITSINQSISRLPEWARGGFSGIGLVGDVSLGGVANPFAGSQPVAGAATQAFETAQGRTRFSGGGALRASGADALAAAGLTRDRAGALVEGAQAPLQSLKDLRSAMADAKAAAQEAEQSTGDLAASLDDVTTSGDKAADSLGGGTGDAGVAKAAEKAKRPIDSLRDGIRSISDGLAAATVAGKGWGDTIKSALQQVAQTWFSQGLERIFLGMAGLGGGGGGFLSSLASAVFPARAMGGSVRAGQIYRVNEAQARSEWMFAGQNGGVLNHGQMQGAVRSALSGQASAEPAKMQIGLDPGLRVELMNEAAQNAAEISQATVSQGQRMFQQSQRRA